MVRGIGLVLTIPKRYNTCMYKSQGNGDKFLNPIYGCGGDITPDVNPNCVGMERYCPKVSKNVLVVDIGLA